MKHLVLIIALFAFLAGSWADMAHAAGLDMNCAHHAADTGEANEPCHDEDTNNAAEPCGDCCCHHVHVLTKMFSGSANSFVMKDRIVPSPQDMLRSQAVNSLYKPPIA